MVTMKFNTEKYQRELDRVGLSYSDLAARIGIKRQTIYQCFAKPESMTFKTVTKLAKALDMDPKDLLVS